MISTPSPVTRVTCPSPSTEVDQEECFRPPTENLRQVYFGWALPADEGVRLHTRVIIILDYGKRNHVPMLFK